MSESDAAVVVAALAAAYPHANIGEATVSVYVADLAELDPVHLGRAAANVRRRCVFFPTIAEIRREYAELRLDLPGAERAFQEALGQPPRHPLVAEARALVGDDWRWRTADTESLRRSFERAYADVRATALEDAVAPLELTR